jgi:hypothetical protein
MLCVSRVAVCTHSEYTPPHDELIQLQYKWEFLLLQKKIFPEVLTCSMTKSCNTIKRVSEYWDCFAGGKAARAWR